MAEASYPEDLNYHPEHDWARIEGDQATFGITWYAQDSARRGRLLRPARGRRRRCAKDEPTPRSSPSRRSPTCIAPLSGEIIEVNEALSDAPETINDDPYGDGWLVKVKLSDPSELEALLDVDAYKKLLQ